MAASPLSAGSSNAGARRLVAVWFADIVGYSSLASRDENAALQQIQNFQTACQGAVSAHGGRLVKFLGDGAFAEFPSTEAAVRAAITLSESFSNAASQSSPDAALRIGVHVGDVVARSDGDLFGDGVNTASRLQAEARPGQILVSGDVWRQLRSLSGLDFRPLGTRALRGIDHPIEVFGVAAHDDSGEGGRGGIADFVQELKRRYVFRVGLTYLIAAWIVIQVSAAVSPALGLPAWTTTLVIVWAALGFPIAIVLAWAFEITPQGIVRTGRKRGVKHSTTPGAKIDSASLEQSHSSISNPPSTKPGRSVLPPEDLPFIGRDAEIREIGALLTDRGNRLVTLTGPGGIGKTTLAVKIARVFCSHFRDGAVFVPLATQNSPAAVLPLVAEHLGLGLTAGIDARVQMVDFLREKSMLVVLDNFEQLVGHATVLAGLLDSAPGVRVLVTSRERLNLKAEVVYPLEGLPTETAARDEYAESEAVRLFVECARRLNPRFGITATDRPCILDLCRHLQGIPLAIELAAAWTRAMNCGEILAEVRRNVDFLATELHDVPERHRSVSTVFESAWQLLKDEERTALKRLSVLQGRFDGNAAAAVAGVGYRPLSSLLDQSLLRRHSDGDFEILEILRQYASAKLSVDDVEFRWIRDRHSSYYLKDLPVSTDRNGSQAIAAVAAHNFDNLRAAWIWASTERRLDDLSAGLEFLFEIANTRGRIQEGQELLKQASEAIEKDSSLSDDLTARRLRAILYVRRGVLCASLGQYADAAEITKKGLAISGDLQLRDEEARALETLGRIAQFRGEYEAASASYESARDLFDALGDRLGRARALIGLGNIAYTTGRYGDAERLYQESLQLHEGSDSTAGLAGALCNLGVLAWTQGDSQRATHLLNRSLEIATDLNDQNGIATALHNLGVVAYLANELQAAEDNLRRGIDLCRRMGFRRHLPAFMNILGKVLLGQGRPADALGSYRQALATGKDNNDLPAMLEAMISVAKLVARQAPKEAAAIATFVHENTSADHECRSSARSLLDALAESANDWSSEGADGPPAIDSLGVALACLQNAMDRFDAPAAMPTLQVKEVT